MNWLAQGDGQRLEGKGGVRVLTAGIGRDKATGDGNCRHHRLNGAGSAQGMAHSTLDRGQGGQIGTEQGVHGPGLRLIVVRGACPVQIDVIDVSGGEVGIDKCRRHGLLGAKPLRMGGGRMIGITGESTPQDFSHGPFRLVSLQEQHGCPFGHRHPLPVFIKGPGALFIDKL